MGNRLGVYLRLVGMAALWGASWPWGRIVAQTMPPVTAASLRIAFASLALLIWLYHAHQWTTIKALSAKQWRGLAAAAATGVFGYAMFFMLSLQWVHASKGAIAITLNPAVTLLLAAWLFRERLNTPIVFGLLLAIGGALFALTHGEPWALIAGGVGIGEWLLLGCVGSWVAYTLIGRAVLAGIDALTATAVSAAIGAAMLLMASVLLEGRAAWLSLVDVPLMSWACLFALAFGATTIAYSWYFAGVKAIGAGSAAAYITLVPVFGLVFSSLWLGESMDATLLMGGGAAIVGMLLMQWGRERAG